MGELLSFAVPPILMAGVDKLGCRNMPRSIGDRLDHFEILAPIGAGGMGEVYKARDTRIDRVVAIKVAKEKFSDRFEREARAISALNHPHICTLYDLGSDFLVMEFVEGETLAARLQKGALPMELVLRYGAEIADALAAAHAKGIIHRDLKPANLIVTKTGVKVLDFGLAKIAQRDETLTECKIVMGTPAYMAPEQMKGESCDARTDIFALGLVLREMATGERLPQKPLKPPALDALDALVRTCLTANPEERWQSARDVKLALDWVRDTGSIPSGTPRRQVVPWAVAGVLGLTALVVTALHSGGSTSYQRAITLSLNPPENNSFSDLAISPDGSRVAFTATDPVKTQLWVRSLEAAAPQPLSGTEGAVHPFWSPDGRWIGFFADGRLKKIEASGGPAHALANAPYQRGGSWSKHGIIVFAPNFSGPLQQVSDSGGEPTPVTAIDPSRPASSHRQPWFLPDGRRFLFQEHWTEPERRGVYAGSLDTRDSTRVLNHAGWAEYATSPDGGSYLIFLRGGDLVAQPFDTDKLQVTGEPVSLANAAASNSISRFSTSHGGNLIYAGASATTATPVWFDRRGTRLNVATPTDLRRSITLDLASDGRLALGVIDPQTQNSDIWILDAVNGIHSRFTSARGIDSLPVWSENGSEIYFYSNRGGVPDLYRKPTGEGDEELLLKTTLIKRPTSSSKDGRSLLFQEYNPKTHWDLWLLPLEGRREPVPILRTEFDEEYGRFSPDGRWIAYQSNESQQHEVYVRAFDRNRPAAGNRWRISTKGGVEPRWRGDNRELFYLSADRKLMSVEVKISASGAFEYSQPRELFSTRALGIYSRFAVTPDGERFVVLTRTEEDMPRPATVVVNWAAGLKK